MFGLKHFYNLQFYIIRIVSQNKLNIGRLRFSNLLNKQQTQMRSRSGYISEKQTVAN